MAFTSIGIQKVHRVGSDLVVTIPVTVAEVLGITEGDQVEVSLQPLELLVRLDPVLRTAMDTAWEQTEPGLRHLADR